MAEIKSTLDIIMEKTRGLTMTEEEKAVLREKEVERKARGLFQKYLDGAIPFEGFKKELDRLGAGREKALAILRSICIEMMDPNNENDRLCDLLREVAGVDGSHIERALANAGRDLETRRRESMERLRKALAESGISGSAVQPNLHADPQWKENLSQIRERFCTALFSTL